MSAPKPGERWRYIFDGYITSDGGLATDSNRYLAPDHLQRATSVERLPDPDPEWQPGDVILDAAGRLWRLDSHPVNGRWVNFNGGVARDLEGVPRPLTPLARYGKPWSEATS